MIRLVLLLLALATPAAAHFQEGTQIREIVVTERDGETRIYVRAPLPLVFADVAVAAAEAGAPLASPFLYPEQTGTGPRYRLSAEAVAEAPDAFAERLATALRFSRDGLAVVPEIVAWRIAPRRPGRPFDSASVARAFVAEPTTGLDPVFGEGVAEYELRLSDAPGALSVQSARPSLALPAGVRIDNHLTRDAGGRVVTATVPGQLQEAAAIPRTPWAAFASFVELGVSHILTGLDHVFLVVCFALGIGWTQRLLWVVTAFTLGHSVTLVMGAAGVVPQVPRFIPAIEAAIAGSVALAALAAWRRRFGGEGLAGPTLAAAVIGLVHGVGFASFLSDSLSPGSPAFVPALAGFNIGIEVGQVVLVGLTLAAFHGISRAYPPAQAPARALALGAIALVAAFWFGERVTALV